MHFKVFNYFLGWVAAAVVCFPIEMDIYALPLIYSYLCVYACTVVTASLIDGSLIAAHLGTQSRWLYFVVFANI